MTFIKRVTEAVSELFAVFVCLIAFFHGNLQGEEAKFPIDSNSRAQLSARNNLNPAGQQVDDTERLELRTKLSLAADVFNKLASGESAEIPTTLSSKAECIAVLPRVVKAAFFAGGQHGSGVVSCRDEKLGWTAPAFVTLSSGSIGFQIGAQEVDVVLLMMSKDSARSLTFNKLTLGGDIAVAAGPVGRLAKGETDLSLSGIYSYAASRGVFAGVSLEGSVLRPDDEATSTYYRNNLMIEDILFKYSVVVLPHEASRYVAALPRW